MLASDDRPNHGHDDAKGALTAILGLQNRRSQREPKRGGRVVTAD